jgi:hypothetical protein
MKTVSKLPEKYYAYDTFLLLNQAIERESPINPSGYGDYTPMDIIRKYRNSMWKSGREDYMFKDFVMSYNTSVDMSGGTQLVKYFTAVDFAHEGDLLEDLENNLGYSSDFGYNRVNVRSNLDFKLTPTTDFSVNLFVSNDPAPYLGNRTPTKAIIPIYGLRFTGRHPMPCARFIPMECGDGMRRVMPTCRTRRMNWRFRDLKNCRIPA